MASADSGLPTPYMKLRYLFASSTILSLAVGFGGGFLFFKHQNAVPSIVTQVINQDQGKSSAVDFSLFWQVWDRLHARYVDQDTLDSQKLVYGAIAGMVDAAGDPYTVFFEPVTAKQFEEQVTGAFSGVGMEIGKRNDAITVIAPIKDSPAMKAGIKTNDIIAKIDDKVTDGMSADQAVTLIRGKKGTTVKLTVIRSGQSQPLIFTLVRDTIKIPAIDWKMIDGHIAYMQIYSFNGNVDDEFTVAAKEIAVSGADRLVIDVRGNPGGLLDAAVDMAGWLLPANSVVVQEKDGNGLIDQLRAQGNARLAKLPTVVIMDGGSASASEILAGALHDDRNIPLVGQKSFGKGSVQQVENFFDGSSLKVTIAKWLTPSGLSISKTGITPTIEVKLDDKLLASGSYQLGVAGKDPQFDKALEIVKGLK